MWAVPLKATLVWSDYPEVRLLRGGSGVNDLDLILIDPSSNRHYPNNAEPERSRRKSSTTTTGATMMLGGLILLGTGFAVRFTPASYPAVLEGVRFSMIYKRYCSIPLQRLG